MRGGLWSLSVTASSLMALVMSTKSAERSLAEPWKARNMWHMMRTKARRPMPTMRSLRTWQLAMMCSLMRTLMGTTVWFFLRTTVERVRPMVS